MRNQFAGVCKDCQAPVAATEGYFEKQPRGVWPKWRVRCARCVAVGKQARGDSLTPHQAAALSPPPPSTKGRES